MTDYKKIVPEEFYRGDQQPMANDVGELIDQLSRLPRNLPLTEPHKTTVYNIKTQPVVQVEEDDQW